MNRQQVISAVLLELQAEVALQQARCTGSEDMLLQELQVNHNIEGSEIMLRWATMPGGGHVAVRIFKPRGQATWPIP